MPDREKVIKELHDARRYLEDKEWFDKGASPHIDAINNALVMLKEQEHKDVIFCALEEDWKRLKELLKEQEAVEPEKEHSGSGITWWNVCGNCKTAINPNDKYCHECGRPILWEGR